MGLAGDRAGCSVADTVMRAGPGKLEPTENQQELQPTACSEHTHTYTGWETVRGRLRKRRDYRHKSHTHTKKDRKEKGNLIKCRVHSNFIFRLNAFLSSSKLEKEKYISITLPSHAANVAKHQHIVCIEVIQHWPQVRKYEHWADITRDWGTILQMNLYPVPNFVPNGDMCCSA